jgi:hypothetical protein
VLPDDFKRFVSAWLGPPPGVDGRGRAGRKDERRQRSKTSCGGSRFRTAASRPAADADAAAAVSSRCCSGLILPMALLLPALTPLSIAADVGLLAAFAWGPAARAPHAARGPAAAARAAVPGAPAEIAVLLESDGVVRVQCARRSTPRFAPAPLRAELLVSGAAAWRYELVPRRRGTCAMGPLTASRDRAAGPGPHRSASCCRPRAAACTHRCRGKARSGRLLVLAAAPPAGSLADAGNRGAGKRDVRRAASNRAGDPLAKVHWKATARQGGCSRARRPGSAACRS